jgi:glutamate-1-semialdehyde aminotransferase
MTSHQATIDRDHLAALIDRERSAYRAGFPGSRDAFSAAGHHLLGGVPMTWMRMWPGGFPIYHATASGARLTDIDGHEFIDFCLGDTGAMAGHSPAAVQAAVARRYGELGGATTMLPTQDAAELDEYLHLHMINRGVLMTPFHNMALMCPATAEADADTHAAVFAAAADDLLG